MPDLTFPQLNSDQGTATADALRNRANAAANLVCDMWENYPAALIPTVGDPLGVGAFSKGLLDGLCVPRGKQPPDPQPPFSGGQCNVLYSKITTRTNSLGTSTFDTGNSFGAFSNYRVIQIETPTGKAQQAVVDQAVGTPDQRLGLVLATGQPDVDGGNASFSFAPVRVDGTPDNCGSPPPSYPPAAPPPSAYERPAPITQYNVPITVPVVLIPVTFAPGAIQFRPEFNVDVGGVNVNFDLGGVNFSIGGSPGQTPQLPSVDPRNPPPKSLPPQSPTRAIEKYDDAKLQCRVKSLQEGLLDDGFDVSNGTTPTAQSGRYVDSRGDFYKVAIVVTQRPSNLPIQKSDSPASNVWFAGWFAWTKDGRPLLRQPIHFQEQSWLAPEEADGFVYQLVFGCLGSGVWQRRVRRDYIDAC